MTPTVRFFWITSLLWLPVAFYTVWVATNGSLSPVALAEHPGPVTFFGCALVFFGIGLHDMYVSDSNLRKNYPVFANLRYLLESIRPEIRQYFIASNLEETPFNREARDLIYRRAKGLNDTLPFGTEHDLMAEGYLTVFHSIVARTVPKE